MESGILVFVFGIPIWSRKVIGITWPLSGDGSSWRVIPNFPYTSTASCCVRGQSESPVICLVQSDFSHSFNFRCRCITWTRVEERATRRWLRPFSAMARRPQSWLVWRQGPTHLVEDALITNLPLRVRQCNGQAQYEIYFICSLIIFCLPLNYILFDPQQFDRGPAFWFAVAAHRAPVIVRRNCASARSWPSRREPWPLATWATTSNISSASIGWSQTSLI